MAARIENEKLKSNPYCDLTLDLHSDDKNWHNRAMRLILVHQDDGDDPKIKTKSKLEG